MVEVAVIEQSVQALYFIQAGSDKLLTAEARFNGHYQDKIHFRQNLFQHY
jgi:hypothetical protein